MWIRERPLDGMALADERVAKAPEIDVENFQTARIVGAEAVLAANDMERRPLLRTRLGDEQCALRELECRESDLPGGFPAARSPAKPPGDHQMNGLKVSGVEYIEAIAAAHAAGRKMGRFLTDYDVILSTTLAGPPPKLGYFDQNGDVQTFTDRVTEYLSVTPLHNATGTPAMSVPLHWTADGLPVGVHFAGRYGEEATLLALAAQLEAAQPWFDRVPAL